MNNAGLSIYGPIEEVPVEDARRLFNVNYWGVVHGTLTAVSHLKDHGGAIINLGSVTSDRAIPLQGHYSASKHAVKAFTDALRMELEKEGAPVSLTLIKPGAIDTPFPEHARNYMEAEPKHPAPVYDPSVVADAIIFCAEHARRDLDRRWRREDDRGDGERAARGGSRHASDNVQGQKLRKASRAEREDSLYEPQGGGTRAGQLSGYGPAAKPVHDDVHASPGDNGERGGGRGRRRAGGAARSALGHISPVNVLQQSTDDRLPTADDSLLTTGHDITRSHGQS